MSQGSAAKAKALYLPRARTVGYAVLVALCFEEEKSGMTMWTKEQVADLAYPRFTETEIIKKVENRKDKGKSDFYDGWSSVKTTLMNKHGLVERIKRKPSEGRNLDHYKRTDEGRERAQMLIKKHNLDASGPQVDGVFGFGVPLVRANGAGSSSNSSSSARSSGGGVDTLISLLDSDEEVDTASSVAPKRRRVSAAEKENFLGKGGTLFLGPKWDRVEPIDWAARGSARPQPGSPRRPS